MSSTNRSGRVTNPDDFFATPEWCTRAILEHIPRPNGFVLDPCCGEGAILRVVRAKWGTGYGIEIDADRAEKASKECGAGVKVPVADALALASWEQPAMVLTNPPFSLAQEFIDRALREVGDRGSVVMLLRLNFLGSQKRAAWHRQWPSDVYVLPRRPSFTGKGTDSCEYMWAAWTPESKARGFGHVRVLELAKEAA